MDISQFSAALDSRRDFSLVWGLGLKVSRIKFMVQGSGFRIQGSGFRIWGSGFGSALDTRRDLALKIREGSRVQVSGNSDLGFSFLV